MNSRTRFLTRDADSPLGKAAIFVKPAVIVVCLLLIVMSVRIFFDYSELLAERERREAELTRLTNSNTISARRWTRLTSENSPGRGSGSSPRTKRSISPAEPADIGA